MPGPSLKNWFRGTGAKLPAGCLALFRTARARPQFASAAAIALGLLVWGAMSFWGWYHLDAARRAVDHGRFSLARRHLNRCLTVWPNSYEAHLLATRVCRVQRDYADARQHLSTCVERSGVTESIEREWVMLDAQTGAFPGLEPQLRNWVDNGPEQTTAALEALVFCLIVQSRVRLAGYYLEGWLRNDPDNGLALYWRGLARQKSGDNRGAIEDYSRSLELDPDNSEGRVQLVQLLFLRNRFEEARRHLAVLAGAGPDDPNVWLLLGLDRFHQAQWEEADRDFSRVLDIDSQHARALYQRGLVALQRGRVAEAERWLRLALTVEPNVAVTGAADNTPLAVTLTEPERAAAHYSLYVCLLQQPARRQSAAAELAAYRECKELTHRLNELLEKIEKQPYDPAPLVAAAEILLQRHEVFVAGQYLQRALQLAPAQETARKLLAKCRN